MTKRSDKLDRLQISVPCSTDWDQMVGTDRIRHCSECSKDVYDISRMTRNEAEALISSARDRLCLRLVRDTDGSTLTLEPFTKLHLAGRRASPIATVVVTAIMGIGGSVVSARPAQASVAASAYSDSAIMKIRGQAKSADSTGTLEGTVLDPNQAVIVGAVVTLRNEESGDVRETSSSDAGTFAFGTLKPGSYTLEIKAEGFSRQLINGIGVSTNQAKQVAVNMTLEAPRYLTVTVGVVGQAPQPLRSLYNQSELIVVARVGDSRKVEREGSSVLMKTALNISSTLKGQTRKTTVYLYRWSYDDINREDEESFVTGNELLVFLKRREDRKTGKTLDGYEVDYPRYGIKKLSAADLAVYMSRIKELREMNQPDVNSPEVVEWLVRCAEETATRWEGAAELAWSAAELRGRQESDDVTIEAGESGESDGIGADEVNEEDTEGSVEEEESETPLISILTTTQMERLAAALYGTVVVSERERELIEIQKNLKDARLLNFLVSQLHVFETDPPEFAEVIVNDVAELMEDEDVNKVLEEYRESASTADESDEAAVKDDDATENDSAEADADKIAAAAATARRRVMLKSFLSLVEKKLNQSANSKSGASASSPDSMH